VNSRAVAWGDLQNAWDLGGLPTTSGVTRHGRIFRSMGPDNLDEAGWRDVTNSGVTTVVDLRNDDEVVAEVSRPDSILVIRNPIEDQSDDDFMSEWGHRLGSPVYYAEILRRWPDLVASAFNAIADAPASVLFHCGAGRDRTGMISAMIEQLVGVERDAILDDYSDACRAFNVWKKSSPGREEPMADEELGDQLETARAELATFLDEHDIASYLLVSGVSAAQLDRIRARLLDA
jgi:protein-tyrosine phosphatase